MEIDKLRQAIKSNTAIEYTAHCQKRMLERDISRADILNSLNYGEVIEDYPLDVGNTSENSFPCCLVLGEKAGEDTKIHIVVGYNGSKILIISACYPDREHWSDDCRTRRK